MEEKKNEIAKLQDQEKSLYMGFQAAIGENNKFANFLMKNRMDTEEALVEGKKITNNLKKKYDALSKKVKIVTNNLNAAKEALEVYQ
ncbi:hypothetical protein GH733_002825 [Mirounga leonina]|nr:hypothetical protein GH733_002825 [Mirounga leonina]